MPSKSAKYYQENPEARKKKQAYDAKFNKKPAQRKKRVELIQERRKRDIYGKGGDDVGHTKSGFRMQSPAKNRGSKSNMPGDKRARGGKKK